MIIVWGIPTKQKKLEHNQMFICDRCGQYGRYEITMVYTCFTLFFIPIIKWGKKFFVKTTCCGTTYALDSEIGKSIARGNQVEIKPMHLQGVQGQRYKQYNRCEKCGYATPEEINFCPKCGNSMQ